MREKRDLPKEESSPDVPEGDTTFLKKCKLTWAALIKCVYEVDPLKCPKYDGTMKIISFIERQQSDVIEKILRHCNLWKEEPPRPPPPEIVPKTDEPKLDYVFFEQTCL